MRDITEPPAFIVMNPPGRILHEDYDMILCAGVLMDAFRAAAKKELAYIMEKIHGAMTDEEARQYRKGAQNHKQELPKTNEERVRRTASFLYLQDIYLLAASRLVPEKDLVKMIPPPLASREIADVVQRYDMFTMSRLIRQAVR